ncbi:type II toxin-antitoxin system VapC family toxin [Cellulomonas septica]|uniref:Type II toxin-antitoxin system VapC family toxin n=1 Tax=Cellulomonas septica TaxID=285080 RepID=A0ABX1K558_9CELL|nr:PIN domain-containing protein [Cellulomonas septica]NKY41695.1 type II toxin-antitoxin system VapC family toxin [Cellulomonas septica]
MQNVLCRLRWLTSPPISPRVYVDGSALSRYLVGAPARDAWLAWAADHEDRLVTTFLGVSELRRVARPRGVEAHGVAHDVTDRVEVVRFSDQSLHAAARVAAVLPSFVALHVGAAVAHAQVGAVATYDVQLAQVAVLHGLEVVSPGWPAGWWERARASS